MVRNGHCRSMTEKEFFVSTSKLVENKKVSGSKKRPSVVKQAHVRRRKAAAEERQRRERRRQGQCQATLNGYVHHQRKRGKKISRHQAVEQLQVQG